MGTNPSKNIIYGKVFNTLFADYNKFLNEKDFEWLLQNVEYIINEHGGDMTKDGAGSKNLFTLIAKAIYCLQTVIQWIKAKLYILMHDTSQDLTHFSRLFALSELITLGISQASIMRARLSLSHSR